MPRVKTCLKLYKLTHVPIVPPDPGKKSMGSLRYLMGQAENEQIAEPVRQRLAGSAARIVDDQINRAFRAVCDPTSF